MPTGQDQSAPVIRPTPTYLHDEEDDLHHHVQLPIHQLVRVKQHNW